ncbi:hypothetical protein HBB16_06885 [Pseudonocardia sp. MCCB 268]|nr:hypothetical protein [Pseudonocardia cytotoxica]
MRSLRLLRPRDRQDDREATSTGQDHPGAGCLAEFDVDKRDTVGVRIDRKRRQPVTVLLKASAGPPSRSAAVRFSETRS